MSVGIYWTGDHFVWGSWFYIPMKELWVEYSPPKLSLWNGTHYEGHIIEGSQLPKFEQPGLCVCVCVCVFRVLEIKPKALCMLVTGSPLSYPLTQATLSWSVLILKQAKRVKKYLVGLKTFGHSWIPTFSNPCKNTIVIQVRTRGWLDNGKSESKLPYRWTGGLIMLSTRRRGETPF